METYRPALIVFLVIEDNEFVSESLSWIGRKSSVALEGSYSNCYSQEGLKERCKKL